MHQVVFSAGIRPGIVKVGSILKAATIARRAHLDLLDSLCSLFLRNLILVGEAAVFAAICLRRFSRYSRSLLRTLTRTWVAGLVLEARVMPGTGTSVETERD